MCRDKLPDLPGEYLPLTEFKHTTLEVPFMNSLDERMDKWVKMIAEKQLELDIKLYELMWPEEAE